MLRGIHKATSTWIGKAVMGVIMGGLIISFAIWGIGDIFRGFGQNSVAKIGGTEISIEQFRNYYTEKLQQLGQRMRRPISNDQARALGLDRQLLGQLVAETTLDEQAKQMRLGLADKDIADRITSDPAFRGVNGQFDRSRFEQIIRNAGFNEARFVAEQRNVMLRRQIAQTVSGDLKVPETTLKSIAQYQGEKRAIQYIALDRRAGRRRARRHARRTRQVFRDPQGAVPRAGISQGDAAVAVRRAISPSRKPSRTKKRRRLTNSARTASARRKSASCARSFSRSRKTPPPRMSASPRA